LPPIRRASSFLSQPERPAIGIGSRKHHSLFRSD